PSSLVSSPRRMLNAPPSGFAVALAAVRHGDASEDLLRALRARRTALLEAAVAVSVQVLRPGARPRLAQPLDLPLQQVRRRPSTRQRQRLQRPLFALLAPLRDSELYSPSRRSSAPLPCLFSDSYRLRMSSL